MFPVVRTCEAQLCPTFGSQVYLTTGSREHYFFETQLCIILTILRDHYNE